MVDARGLEAREGGNGTLGFWSGGWGCVEMVVEFMRDWMGCVWSDVVW